MAPGQAVRDSLGGRRVGHRVSVVACSSGLELQHESCFWLQVLGSAHSWRGLCCSQRLSSYTGTHGATIPGAGGSWDGPGLLQLASLESIQAEQGLCCRYGGFARSSEPGCHCPVGRTGRLLSGAQSPKPWDAAKPQLRLQSLWLFPRKAEGEKKTFPQLKAQARRESWSLYCRSPEQEGGAGFELPAALSCSTKQPPSLASEIQREVLKL